MRRWVEHTAEVELEIETADEEGVFAEALAALGELLGEDPVGEPARHQLAVTAADRPALLAEWLSELVFLAEVESFVPERVVSIELTDTGLRAAVAGRRGHPPPLVKAVTYHRLEFRQAGGVWRARVVLDV